MRGGLIGVLGVALGLLVATPAAATTTRAQCLAACAATIAQCGTACGVFADLDASCRRAVTTTTKPPTTSLHATTTAHRSTSTTSDLQ